MINVWMDLAGGFYMDARIIQDDDNHIKVFGFGSTGLSIWEFNKLEFFEKMEIINSQIKNDFDYKNVEDLPWILLEYSEELNELTNEQFYYKYKGVGDEDDYEFDFYKLNEEQKQLIMQ